VKVTTMKKARALVLLLLSAILFAGGFFLPVTGPLVQGGEPFSGWRAFRHCVDMVMEHHTIVGAAVGLAGILANIAVCIGLFCWLKGSRRWAVVSAIVAVGLGLALLPVVWQLVWAFPGYWIWLASFGLLLFASDPADELPLIWMVIACPSTGPAFGLQAQHCPDGERSTKTPKFDRADMIALAGLLLLLAAVAALLYLLFHRSGEVNDSHEALLAVARDPSQTRDARGEAVSRLLACYVHANANAATVHEVFADCEWISDARITSIGAESGDPCSRPFYAKEAGALFYVEPFAPKEEVSEWRMVVEFSGYNHSLEDVRRFFSPNAEPDNRFWITQLALFNPRVQRWEIVDDTGRHPFKCP
jgi:hypothetical protein